MRLPYRHRLWRIYLLGSSCKSALARIVGKDLVADAGKGRGHGVDAREDAIGGDGVGVHRSVHGRADSAVQAVEKAASGVQANPGGICAALGLAGGGQAAAIVCASQGKGGQVSI